MIKRFRAVDMNKYFPVCPRLRRNVVVDRDGWCKENPKGEVCRGCWSNDLEELAK